MDYNRGRAFYKAQCHDCGRAVRLWAGNHKAFLLMAITSGWIRTSPDTWVCKKHRENI